MELLARRGEFEPSTLGLEMCGFVVTNCIELSRFIILKNHFTRCLRKWLKDSLAYAIKL